MENKIVVAVIDSGINKNDEKISNQDIQDLYYENKEFKSSYEGKTNIHGTEIIKVLLREAPDITIISIRTLLEDNRCTLSSIIDSIQYCIDIGVDIINLSLGSCTRSSRRLNDLKTVCERATDQGIIIFAADNNISGKKSYPANFENVISVNTPDHMDAYCKISFRDKCVEFSENFVNIPDGDRCIIRKGNSYLCPMLVGIFCQLIKKKDKNENSVMEYMEFLEEFSRQETISKIYFNKHNQADLDYLMDRKVYFFADDMDFNNGNLFEFYKENGVAFWCFNDIFGKTIQEIYTFLDKVDVFFIGVLGNQFLKENEVFINELIKQLIKKQKNIITVLPIVNTYDRIMLAKKDGQILKSIYK